MSVQDFALEATGAHRVQVQWSDPSSPATILLNGSLLGTLAAEEQHSGNYFTLPDQSQIHVVFANGYPHVVRNGFALPPVAAQNDSVGSDKTNRKHGGCLKTFLILNIVAGVFACLMNLLNFVGLLVEPEPGFPAWTMLVYALLSVCGIVGVSGLLAWKKWGFYALIFSAVASIPLMFVIGAENAGAPPFIGLAILFFWYKRSKLWDKLD